MQQEFFTCPLFRGMTQTEVLQVLDPLGAVQKQYSKSSVIFPEGKSIDRLGIVLSGRVLIQYNDVWGTSSMLGSAHPGDTFGEAYACCPGEALLISAVAAEDTAVLFLSVSRMLRHPVLMQNLLTVCAYKNLALSRRMLYTTPKTIRGRLLSYFSACVKQSGTHTFTLPYNRQQLADYLGVDRSALCSELSKMQKDGLIRYHKNTIEIRQEQQLMS